MSSLERTFPRYATGHLKIEIQFPVIEHAIYYLEDASLAGIQIYGKSKIITNNFNQIKIKLSEKEIFTVHAHQVWFEEDVPLDKIKQDFMRKHFTTPPFRSGLRLKFVEDKHYEKWLKFITALHVLESKSPKEK